MARATHCRRCRYELADCNCLKSRPCSERALPGAIALYCGTSCGDDEIDSPQRCGCPPHAGTSFFIVRGEPAAVIMCEDCGATWTLDDDGSWVDGVRGAAEKRSR